MTQSHPAPAIQNRLTAVKQRYTKAPPSTVYSAECIVHSNNALPAVGGENALLTLPDGGKPPVDLCKIHKKANMSSCMCENGPAVLEKIARMMYNKYV